jgi:hypothetical protein
VIEVVVPVGASVMCVRGPSVYLEAQVEAPAASLWLAEAGAWEYWFDCPGEPVQVVALGAPKPPAEPAPEIVRPHSRITSAGA